MKHKTELQRHLIVTEHAKLGSVRAVATKLGINRATVRVILSCTCAFDALLKTLMYEHLALPSVWVLV